MQKLPRNFASLGFSLALFSTVAFAAYGCVSREFNNSQLRGGSFGAATVKGNITHGASEIAPANPGNLNICSFNIQFLGSYKKRDTAFLAESLKNCDVLVVQELIAHPKKYVYPDSVSWTEVKKETDPTPDRADGDAEARSFFEEMKKRGFTAAVSTEDTGATAFHSESTGNEWFVAFYKHDKISIAADLPKLFLSEKRFANEIWDRVPYAFPFRIRESGADFVVISVHLHFQSKTKDMDADRAKVTKAGLIKEGQPDVSIRDVDRLIRLIELDAIYKWIQEHKTYTDKLGKTHTEQDFLIAGDMNIGDKMELEPIFEKVKGYRTLNPLASLGTNSQGTEGYDHVFVPVASQFQYPEKFQVLNLACRAALLGAPALNPEVNAPPESSGVRTSTEGAPCAQLGDAEFQKQSEFLKMYQENSKTFWTEFRYRYSDHLPVFFQIPIPKGDAD